jgi:FixJ family two-component response regulator
MAVMDKTQGKSTRKDLLVVVDDDASFLKAVARLLRTAGFVVETFASPGSF